VHATQADTDEDILWLWDEQLDLLNLSCQVDNIGGPTRCGLLSTLDVSNCFDDDNLPVGFFVAGALTQFGRARHERVLKSRRRLREREALFLLTEFVNGGPQLIGEQTTWPIRRNVYMRYAVRPSR